MEKKDLLALMSALIYGQSKTLTAPECVGVAKQLWEAVEEKTEVTPKDDPRVTRTRLYRYRSPIEPFHDFMACMDNPVICHDCGAHKGNHE